ncbi:MAG: glycerol dehydrogenase [Candidatus Methanomethylophilaceae archaeon]|nr:glycerol dehydrogenase [Candidatus Methanomethylophilaceae archaeon]
MNARETAWRVFAGELNSSSLEMKSEEEKSPSYLVTPLGAKLNRILITGVLLDKENTGTEEEPMWRGRIQDVSGNFFINVGRFQPNAAASMADLEAPSYVAVVGKVRTYTADDGRVFVTVRPETITNIDERTRNLWVLEAAQSTWDRLVKMKDALRVQNAGKQDLVNKGFSQDDADGIISALEHYGIPESSKYLKLIQNSLRMLLPDRNIDLGLPEDIADAPDEIVLGEDTGKGKDFLLSLLEAMDMGELGVSMDVILKKAAENGMTPEEVEEASDALMDDGLAYEPKVGFLKAI